MSGKLITRTDILDNDQSQKYCFWWRDKRDMDTMRVRLNLKVDAPLCEKY